MIPYSEITEAADRRWTLRLLERLVCPGVDEKELQDVVRALESVSDPRSFARLEEIVGDVDRPVEVRRAASNVLRGQDHIALDIPEEKLRRWWQKGDEILRWHALLSMDGISCPDILLEVAPDSSHAFQAAAIGRMLSWFDAPEHEAIKIAGLSHPDPEVRAAAADVLMWDEPVAAETPLIKAASDSAPEVAAAAANTLQYYTSRKAICCLHGLLHHGVEEVRAEAQDSFQAIRAELLFFLCRNDPPIKRRICHWLQPVWHLLAFSDEELRPNDEEASSSYAENNGKSPVPLKELLDLLADPDISPGVLGDRLRSNEWQEYRDDERRQLRPVLLAHADQIVRDQAGVAFEEWQDVSALTELMRDPDFCVRKTAMYCLGQLPPMAKIADLAWNFLQRSDVLGVHSTETLNTFVIHASPDLAIPRLKAIADDRGRREGIRVAALDHLVKLRATEQVGQLTKFLSEPPAVTWALHISLLRAVIDLQIPSPDVQHLAEVDNLHVQMALARFEQKS